MSRFNSETERVVRGANSATLSVTLRNQYGERANAAGTVTVTITRANGTTLVTGGATSQPSVDGTGIYQYAIAAAHLKELDRLTCVWTDSGNTTTYTTYVEIAGAVYASIEEIRKADKSLEDQSKYPDAVIRQALRETEDEFERICNVAFVPRYEREQLTGRNTDRILLSCPLPRTIRSVRVYDSNNTTYAAFDSSDLAALVLDRSGTLVRSNLGKFVAGNGNIVIEYEHGWTQPPAEIRKAAIQRVRYRLNQTKSGIPDRAESFSSTDGGTFRLSIPGQYTTGAPDIDAVLARYSLRVPGIA